MKKPTDPKKDERIAIIALSAILLLSIMGGLMPLMYPTDYPIAIDPELMMYSIPVPML